MLFGKKKKRIAFLLGCLWYYIKKIEDVDRFAEATDIITNVCVELGIDWEKVNNAEKSYVRWRRGNIEDRSWKEEKKGEPVGLKGPVAWCPSCGTKDIKWDAENDICICMTCGRIIK